MFARGRCVAHNGTIAAWSGLPGYRGGHKFTRSTRSASTIASKDVIFSGIQPTGIPHLGNYLGALRQWVRLQNSSPSGTKLLFSVVDLHALTGRQDPKQLLQWKKESLASLLAVGLDPKRSTIFHQSNVSFQAFLQRPILKNALGLGSRRIDVDSKLQCLDGLPLKNDPVESLYFLTPKGCPSDM
jgi:tryptophanyl-tRNA synthetase